MNLSLFRGCSWIFHCHVCKFHHRSKGGTFGDSEIRSRACSWFMYPLYGLFFISNHSDTIRLVFWNMAFIFPYIGNSNPNWLIFFRGVGQPPISTMILCRSLAFWDPHIWRRSPQKRGPSPTPSPISIHLDTCYPENRWDSDKTPGWTVNYHGKLGGSK